MTTSSPRPSDDGATEVVDDVVAYVARREAEQPRWVWDDTTRWYPELLAAGVRVARCHDLRLCHLILRSSALTATSTLATAEASGWDAPFTNEAPAVDDALFDLADERPPQVLDPVAEFRLQQAALEGDQLDPADARRLARLLAAESAGALIAAEMTFMGLPWRADVHDRILEEILGPKPPPGERPAKLQALAIEVREKLEAPDLNPDSPVDLLKALGNAGLRVTTTAKWELQKLKHPVIEPLLEYKKLSRLLSANGWHWLDTWVADGRFRPVYVPGGVVTGRWASDGGGALQLPKQVRGAVIADPGWKLVVADASQLEPRVLTGMARDEAMAKAGEGDLYAGIVASGAVATRDEAKVAMLGAMYGATTGDSGRLMPKLAAGVPEGDRRRRAGRPSGGARRGRDHDTRAQLAEADRLVGAGSGRCRRRRCRSRGRGASAQPRPQLGTVHAQLRRAGQRGGVGAVLDGGHPQPAHRAVRWRAIGGIPAPRVLPARRGRRAHAGRARGGGRRCDPGCRGRSRAPALRRHAGVVPAAGRGRRGLRQRQVTQPTLPRARVCRTVGSS